MGDIVILTGARDQRLCDALNAVVAAVNARSTDVDAHIVWYHGAARRVRVPFWQFAERQIEPCDEPIGGDQLMSACAYATRAILLVGDDVRFDTHFQFVLAVTRLTELRGRLRFVCCARSSDDRSAVYKTVLANASLRLTDGDDAATTVANNVEIIANHVIE